MDFLTLPILAGDTTLTQALEVLKGADRSGGVAELASQPTVLDLGDILAAWREGGGARTIADVSPRVRTVSLPTEEAADEVLSHDGTRHMTESLIDREHAHYAVTWIRGGSGQVVTRHEGLKDFLSTTRTICRCTTNPDHVWLERDLGGGGVCQIDGSPCDCA
ncbi:MAG: hypothetical protein GY798_07500 [Hyphomicrobiales bacterium]|nr:hypothetical protein [Hyphomicrobiales bacterium]